MTRADTAALLSFAIPGLGQLYNGDLARGLCWLCFAAVFYGSMFILTGPLTLGAVIGHAIPAYTAHQRALLRYGRS